MKFKILKTRDEHQQLSDVDIGPQEPKLTVLDALISAREDDPELAFRYGCRNRLCGVCTVNVNGKPKLACRTPAREGMLLEPAVGLPVLQDLVVGRERLNRQLNSRLPNPELDTVSRTQSHEQYDSLGRCVECYACLDGCPLHAKNELTQAENQQHDYANPYAFLRLQRVLCHPAVTHAQVDKTVELALELGLDNCIDCDGCTCGVGIDLMKEVIKPLLEKSEKLNS